MMYLTSVNNTYIIVYFYNNIILVCKFYYNIVCCWELSGMYALMLFRCSLSLQPVMVDHMMQLLDHTTPIITYLRLEVPSHNDSILGDLLQ